MIRSVSLGKRKNTGPDGLPRHSLLGLGVLLKHLGSVQDVVALVDSVPVFSVDLSPVVVPSNEPHLIIGVHHVGTLDDLRHVGCAEW